MCKHYQNRDSSDCYACKDELIENLKADNASLEKYIQLLKNKIEASHPDSKQANFVHTETVVEKWIGEFQSLLNNAPKNHWLFMSEGGLHLMRMGKNRKRVETECGSMDQSYIEASFSCSIPTDGGGW